MRFVHSPMCQGAALALVVVLLSLHLRQVDATFVPDNLPHDEALELESNRLDQFRGARNVFIAYMDNVVNDIVWRGLALKEAAERIHDYCQNKYPVFLYHLNLTQPGSDDRQKIAWNIVLHVRMELEEGNFQKWPLETLERLENELGVMVGVDQRSHPALLSASHF